MSYTTDLYGTFYNLKKVNENHPIVFIHGVGLNSEIWNSQINFFKNYSEGCSYLLTPPLA